MRRLNVIIPLTALSACTGPSSFDIVNGSQRTAEAVTVSDGDRTWKLGSLDPGNRARFSGVLTGEGAPTIEWTIAGRRHSDKGCYYTKSMPSKGRVTIVGNRLKFNCL